MFSTAGFVASCLLLTSVSAAPYDKRWFGSEDKWWQPSKAVSFLDFGKRWGVERYAATCDLQRAVSYMNLGAASSPSPLPAPSDDMELFQVVIGRGTQNYTCDLANSSAVPAPVGALATLFNVSCVAADMPELLNTLPGIALELPAPSSDSNGIVDKVVEQDMSGHHYFVNDTTPFFNMNTAIHDYGTGAVKKSAAADAPEGAIKGQHGTGNGAVSWLYLEQNDAPQWGSPDWKAVYRLNTAGGNPPELCSEQGEEAFTVEYAAEYWLFK